MWGERYCVKGVCVGGEVLCEGCVCGGGRYCVKGGCVGGIV